MNQRNYIHILLCSVLLYSALPHITTLCAVLSCSVLFNSVRVLNIMRWVLNAVLNRVFAYAATFCLLTLTLNHLLAHRSCMKTTHNYTECHLYGLFNTPLNLCCWLWCFTSSACPYAWARRRLQQLKHTDFRWTYWASVVKHQTILYRIVCYKARYHHLLLSINVAYQ